jgi:Abortive infection alpha
MPNEWLELAKGVAKLPAILTDIYGDLLRPGVKQVGKALETVIGLGNTILWPFALVNGVADITLKRSLEKYRAKLENVPADEIIQVRPEIGVPIAERLSYVHDDYLSDLFVNLLAKASIKNNANLAHPSFVNIIDNLSPDEGLMLYHLKQRRYSYVRRSRIAEGEDSSTYSKYGEIEDTIIENKFPIQELSLSSNFAMYVDHLVHMNILLIRVTGSSKKSLPIMAKCMT